MKIIPSLHFTLFLFFIFCNFYVILLLLLLSLSLSLSFFSFLLLFFCTLLLFSLSSLFLFFFFVLFFISFVPYSNKSFVVCSNFFISLFLVVSLDGVLRSYAILSLLIAQFRIHSMKFLPFTLFIFFSYSIFLT